MIRPLTSIRFFFAFIVFLCHIDFITANPDSSIKSLYANYFSEGQIGVSFFFMLSGFILAYSYKTKLTKHKVSRKTFWLARFARVYPLHIITMLIAIPYALLTLNTNKLDWCIILGSQITLTQSFWPFTSFHFSLNGPAWSISCEAFFYLMFPFLISWIFGQKKRLNPGVLCVGCLIVAIPVIVPWIPDHLKFWFFNVNPLTRIADFIIGILLHEIYVRYKDKLTRSIGNVLEIMSVLMLIIFFVFHNDVSYIYRLSSYYWLPISLVIVSFSFQQGFLSRVISGRLFVVLGEISFAFYLIHQPVIRYTVLLDKNYRIFNNDLVKCVAMLAISVILGYLLHFHAELPFNKLIKEKLGGSVKDRVPGIDNSAVW